MHQLETADVHLPLPSLVLSHPALPPPHSCLNEVPRKGTLTILNRSHSYAKHVTCVSGSPTPTPAQKSINMKGDIVALGSASSTEHSGHLLGADYQLARGSQAPA